MLVEFSLEQLAKQADMIVEAHVTAPAVQSASVRLGPTDFLLAFTDSRVHIDNKLKAPPFETGNEVLIRTLGGRTPEADVTVDSEAQLSAKEDVILFLTRNFPVDLPPNVFAVMGGFQGKFSVSGSAHSRVAARAGADQDAIGIDNLRRAIKQYLDINEFAAAP